jgi:hypothetical protein
MSEARVQGLRPERDKIEPWQARGRDSDPECSRAHPGTTS